MSELQQPPAGPPAGQPPEGSQPGQPTTEKAAGRLRGFHQRFNDFCARHSFRPRGIRVFLITAVAVFLGLAFLAATRTNISSQTTALGLRDIGELATQAAYFTEVQQIRKARDVLGVEVPGTQSNYVYSYRGVIRAGFDFRDIALDVDDVNRVITVKLPEVRILSTEIDEDSFTLYNDGKNLFTSLTLDDINRSNIELKQSAKETAVANGLLESARTNAEMLIRGFLSGIYDLTVYTVQFE